MNGSRQHDTAVRSTANDLEDRGYSVIIEVFLIICTHLVKFLVTNMN